jgi:hypothetical protein
MTAEAFLWEIWRLCLLKARKDGSILADDVESFIANSRALLTAWPSSERDIDFLLFEIFNTIHWDWDQPTDRVFETLLEFELTEFFAKRSLD